MYKYLAYKAPSSRYTFWRSGDKLVKQRRGLAGIPTNI